MWFGRMPTSMGVRLKNFHYTKNRVTKKGIYTNSQVLKISKNTLEPYHGGALHPLSRGPYNLSFVLNIKNTSLNGKCRCSTWCATLPSFHSVIYPFFSIYVFLSIYIYIYIYICIAWNSTWDNRLGHLLSNIWRH